ncbi:MAG: response regulator transcription factor, partial [Coriobacteriales bacterium]|nr:response regulator transcription factor [Coriobacteriales bacterium]
VYALKQAGLEVQGFGKAEEFYAALESQAAQPELILLDIMLPDEDGIQILNHLRSQESSADIPIMMITAKGSEYDVVVGLDAGADDYMVKPFGMMELVSRVNALLRRGAKTDAADLPLPLREGDIELWPRKHMVFVAGQPVDLTLKEFDLLRFLMENPGLVFTREHLLESLWGWSFGGNTRTIDVHVQTLRHKLGPSGKLVETVRGLGYRFRSHSRGGSDQSECSAPCK